MIAGTCADLTQKYAAHRGVHMWCMGLGDRRVSRAFTMATRSFADFVEVRTPVGRGHVLIA